MMWPAALLVASVFVSPRAQAYGWDCIAPDLGRTLAGADAVDCGIVGRGAWSRRRVVACARKAIEKGRAVRFGTGIVGVDAGVCDVVARDAQGVFWKLEYAYDFSRPGRDGRPIASELSVRKCPGIDLDWKDPEGLGRFGPLICDDDPEAFRRSAHEALL